MSWVIVCERPSLLSFIIQKLVVNRVYGLSNLIRLQDIPPLCQHLLNFVLFTAPHLIMALTFLVFTKDMSSLFSVRITLVVWENVK